MKKSLLNFEIDHNFTAVCPPETNCDLLVFEIYINMRDIAESVQFMVFVTIACVIWATKKLNSSRGGSPKSHLFVGLGFFNLFIISNFALTDSCIGTAFSRLDFRHIFLPDL
jgi:hypothetical protein